MAIVRNNERSQAIKVITYINMYLKDKSWCIGSAGGETTIVQGKKHMFPDVILYGDSSQTQILQGWELKMPDVPIDNVEFIKDAQRKAITLGLNSCVTWNFTTGVLYERDKDDVFREIRRWDATNHIKTRQDVDTYRDDWMRVIGEILEEINGYFLSGRFLPADLGEIISDSIICAIIQRNKHPLADKLKAAGRCDIRIHAGIQNWWKQVKTEYASEEADAYVAYARILILNWCNRLLFAHVIKRYHNIAREIDTLTYDSKPEMANALFESISGLCDYHNIFAALRYNEYLPETTRHDLMELNEFLSSKAVTGINQTTLQIILERTISSSKRELVGQFTTPDKLAVILARVTMRNLSAPCIDPCCGTGSIAQAMLENKIKHGITISDTYQTTWASDKFSFPLQIASIGLARVDAMNQPLKIFQKNAFELEPKQSVVLTDPATGRITNCELPLFESIVSNLPFVPFEIIDGDEQLHIINLNKEMQGHTGIALDERADLYQYLLLALHHILAPNGRLGIITSNSWLGTKAGRQFFDLLGWYYHINQVHISGNGRWFHNADVVAVALILTKKATVSEPCEKDITRFYIWQKDVQNMEESDIEALVSDAVLDECTHTDLIIMSAYSRADICCLTKLNISLNALFHNVNWLVDIVGKLCPVTRHLCVSRGERRGWDKMFYPKDGHGIETQYIRKVLKNSRQLTSLCATPDRDAFCCSASLSELERAGHTGALAWIGSFEHERNKTGVPLTKSLHRKRMYWYEMHDTSTADYVTGINPNRRLFVAKFDEPTFVNQRLIAFRRIDNCADADLLHALLNTILSMFYIEAIGFGRGLGVLDINSQNIGSMMILNPALLNEQSRRAILKAFRPLKERDVFDTLQELGQKDRINFDHVVLTAFGIDQYYDCIKNALLSMQQTRFAART